MHPWTPSLVCWGHKTLSKIIIIIHGFYIAPFNDPRTHTRVKTKGGQGSDNKGKMMEWNMEGEGQDSSYG